MVIAPDKEMKYFLNLQTCLGLKSPRQEGSRLQHHSLITPSPFSVTAVTPLYAWLFLCMAATAVSWGTATVVP